MMDGDVNQHLQEIQREYLDFLDDDEDQGIYHRRVRDMVESKRLRILVDLNDLRKKKPDRVKALKKNAAEEVFAFQNALKEYVHTVDPTYDHEEFFIGFEGSFGGHHVTPRTLVSSFLNSLVCLEGIVTQCSLNHPKLVRSVHYCPATQKMSERRYTDLTSLNPTSMNAPAYPTKDIDGNLLETEFGLCAYKDHQTLIIQEMPEKAPAGQLPRAVDIICDYDLADKCKPGDRVQISGVFRCLPSKQNSFTTGVFRTVLLANNIAMLSKDTKLAVSRDDIAHCRKLSKKKNIFSHLAHSLAPSIHGHEYVKKAILCMLLGGVEKVLPNGTRLRGDINILLIGDPSVAKSQLLRYVLCTAPRAIATTGRGSSGVGLTAAVTMDRETGEKRLEAGAMVLADRGVVCIDEFDKMSDLDRTAIHEVMEQGRVTIAKAGIHARLNARCSVLAAANPVYGKYDQYKPPMENIGLQDSLLSRFDLLFVMLDVINSDLDLVISDHVLRMHRFRNPGEADGTVLPMGSGVDILSTHAPDENDADADIPIFEKYDPLLHGESKVKFNKERIFTVKFMKMYINIAKALKPVLTAEAAEAIAEEYAHLRSQDAIQTGEARTQPVTVRTLETLIRLATAHAKAHLSPKILLRDAQAAIELVQFALFKKVLEKERKRKGRHDSESSDDSDGENEPPNATQAKKRRVRSSASPVADGRQSPTTDGGQVESMDAEETLAEPLVASPDDVIDDDRFAVFKKSLSKIFVDTGAHTIPLQNMIAKINEEPTRTPFSQSEINAAIKKMTDDNQIALIDNNVILI
ncbi:DNA replication licensing factor [Nesidiocoris tenuis]|uniref:DNA replication licensing factor MCM3 n=1 Tax=Nesidiocoris tenuis TaxID=355587 RepID=A0ABN7B2L1_9HEMI|nr:DNA replication licensing factor [Nesidiocoris tenuis]